MQSPRRKKNATICSCEVATGRVPFEHRSRHCMYCEAPSHWNLEIELRDQLGSSLSNRCMPKSAVDSLVSRDGQISEWDPVSPMECSAMLALLAAEVLFVNPDACNLEARSLARQAQAQRRRNPGCHLLG